MQSLFISHDYHQNTTKPSCLQEHHQRLYVIVYLMSGLVMVRVGNYRNIIMIMKIAILNIANFCVIAKATILLILLLSLSSYIVSSRLAPIKNTEICCEFVMQ